MSGPGTHAAAIATTVVGLAALVAIYVAFGRSDADVDDLLGYSAAVVAVTIAFGKVFSPQFLIWLDSVRPARARSARHRRDGAFSSCRSC